MADTRSSAWYGVLPYIGLILFLLHLPFVVWGGAEGRELHRQVLMIAITYLIGWASLGAGITHIFFGKRISRSIGFEANGYEFEVGCCGLAIGIVGLMAGSYGPDFWLATILVSSIYRIGCGIGHVRDIILRKNYAINNTAILFIDFVVPICLLLGYRAYAASSAEISLSATGLAASIM